MLPPFFHQLKFWAIQVNWYKQRWNATMYTLNQIPSETQIKKFLRKTIFGKNLYCPICRSQQISSYESRYRCRRCRTKFSLLSHTWLSEAYGKGWALLLAKQPKTRKLAWGILPERSVQRQHVFQLLQASVKPGSRLQTDGAKIYQTIEQWWPVTHKVDIHQRFEFGLTSEIEGTFGNMRTFIRRMYHHVRPQQMPEYVSEFCYRFSLPEMFSSPNEYLKKTLPLVPRD